MNKVSGLSCFYYFFNNQVKSGLEKAKGTLEAENADLASELRTITNAKQESDRRRKQAEQQLAEVQSKMGENDRLRIELAEKAAKLQQESDSITTQVRQVLFSIALIILIQLISL